MGVLSNCAGETTERALDTHGGSNLIYSTIWIIAKKRLSVPTAGPRRGDGLLALTGPRQSSSVDPLDHLQFFSGVLIFLTFGPADPVDLWLVMFISTEMNHHNSAVWNNCDVIG